MKEYYYITWTDEERSKLYSSDIEALVVTRRARNVWRFDGKTKIYIKYDGDICIPFSFIKQLHPVV